MECLNLVLVRSVSRLLLRLLLSHATSDQANGGGEDPRGSRLTDEVSTSDGWSWMAQRRLRVEHPRIAHHLVCVRAARCWLPRGIEARKDPAKKSETPANGDGESLTNTAKIQSGVSGWLRLCEKNPLVARMSEVHDQKVPSPATHGQHLQCKSITPG